MTYYYQKYQHSFTFDNINIFIIKQFYEHKTNFRQLSW